MLSLLVSSENKYMPFFYREVKIEDDPSDTRFSKFQINIKESLYFI